MKKELERAAGLVAKAREIYEQYAGKDLPEEKATEINQYLTEAKAIKARVDALKELDVLGRYFSEPVRSHPFDNGHEPGKEEKALKAQAFFKSLRNRGLSGLDAETKALVEDVNGEILVPEELESEIYRDLPALTIIRPLATVLPVSANRIRRRSMSEVAVGWGKLETAAQTLTDSMPGTPGEEYQYVEDLYGLAKVGEDELADTDVALQAFIRSSFAQAIAESEDTGFVVGKGHADNEPEGILTATGITRVDATAAGAVSADDVLRLVYDLPAQYRRDAVFIMSSVVELAIRLLKDSQDRYLWQPSLQAGRPNTLAGYPIYNQEDVPGLPAAGGNAADVAIFGSVRAGYRILDRQGMSIKVLDQLYAEDGLVGFRVHARVGGAVIRPRAFRVLAVAAPTAG